MSKSSYSVGVIGASGIVGSEILTALRERGFPLSELRVFASYESAGERLECGSFNPLLLPLDDTAKFDGLDIVFLAAGQQVTAEWRERVRASGAIAIDTSGLFADNNAIPLVVPEVNAADIGDYAAQRFITSPDPIAIPLAVVLAALQTTSPLTNVVATTFEPAAGAGRRGISELQTQVTELLSGSSPEPEVFPHRLAFNVVPQIGEILQGGNTLGEQQSVHALQRLLANTATPISITRARVPVFFGACLSLHVEMQQMPSDSQVRELLRAAPGILLDEEDDPTSYPTTADVVGADATVVGRLRVSQLHPHIDLWVATDSVRKGSAVNAVQIAEILIRDHLGK